MSKTIRYVIWGSDAQIHQTSKDIKLAQRCKTIFVTITGRRTLMDRSLDRWPGLCQPTFSSSLLYPPDSLT